MSTKTSFKRLALVVVSALGFGLLSVAVPSSANAEATVAEVTALQLGGASANVSQTQREDVATGNFTIGVVVDGTDVASAGDTITLYAAFTSKPAASTLTNGSLTFGADASANVNDSAIGTRGDTDATAGTGSAAAKLVLTPTANDSIITDSDVGNLAFTPDVPGTYVVRMWHDANANLLWDSTEATRTLTVTAGAAATALTVTNLNPSAAALSTAIAAFDQGSLFILSMKDTSGNATSLASGEGISVTATGCTISLDGGSNSVSDSATLTSSTSPSNGLYRVNVYRASAGTCVVTFAGAGSLAGAFTSSSSTVTYRDITDSDAATYALDMLTGVDTTTVGAMTSDTAGSAVAASAASGATTFSVSSDAAGTSRYINMTVNDVTGAVTGYAGAKYSQAIALTDTVGTATNYATASVTPKTWSATLRAATNVAGADNYVVTFADLSTTNTDSEGVTVTATAPSMSSTLSTWNVTQINATTGSVITVTLTALDQFGNAWAGRSITFSKTGRNAATTAVTAAVTDADGKATFTYTDAGTATSSTVDTISATTITATVTVTYDAANAVDKVVVTSGDTTAGVADLSVDWKDILAGRAGASTSAYDVTAKVTNASGTVLAGVPVTFTVAEAGCAIPSNEKTTFTDATGVATSAVYAWLAGKCTVTATAGGKTGTGVTSFRQESTSEIRTLEGSVTGAQVTASPKDRFGNPVINGTIYAVITAGTGYFGSNGAKSTSGATDSTGTVTFVVAGGNATVKLTTINPSGSGLATDQSTAAAGFVNGDVATPLAFTATTTGTATTRETGVGASFAPAGISSVTLEAKVDNSAQVAAEAASDAALEAIDAANAATDAANLAAEAADAATVAAEEARDAADAATAAVEALASEVATLIAGLKAQITTLANTVAKIAKRVRA